MDAPLVQTQKRREGHRFVTGTGHYTGDLNQAGALHLAFVAAETMATFKPAEVTFPNGTHICEVEIDPETGTVTIAGFSPMEDIGNVLHPMLAEGQIQGGVAQGIGQALGFRAVPTKMNPLGLLMDQLAGSHVVRAGYTLT